MEISTLSTRERYANKIFNNYKYICTTITMLETTLNNYNFTNEEISGMSLSHAVGSVDYGKSSVRQINQKTLDIALNGENKLNKEKIEIVKKINLYKKVKSQVDCYVNDYLDECSRFIWKLKYIDKMSSSEIAEKSNPVVVERTVTRKLRKFEYDFEKISILTNEEIKNILTELRRK